MAADQWSEEARGLWQSQESIATRLSASDMRVRADRWHREFAGTSWVPFVCAGVFLLFFVPMLAIGGTALQRVGATIGIVSALYLAHVGFRLASPRWVDASAPCVRAYKTQLERRQRADTASARTILLAMTGCALLSGAEDWGPWMLQATSQLAVGIVVYMYIMRQARRFRVRIDELSRLAPG